jgi:hypothetical protein
LVEFGFVESGLVPFFLLVFLWDAPAEFGLWSGGVVESGVAVVVPGIVLELPDAELPVVPELLGLVLEVPELGFAELGCCALGFCPCVPLWLEVLGELCPDMLPEEVCSDMLPVPVVLWPAVLWPGVVEVDGDCGLVVVLCAPAVAPAQTNPVISRPCMAIFSNCFTDESPQRRA